MDLKAKTKDFGKRLIFGGPEYQKRKAQKKADDEMIRQNAHEFEIKGRAAGARDRAYKQGYDKERYRQGGLTGKLQTVQRGINAFDSVAGSLIGDINFEGMGQGIGGDFGFGGQSRKQQRRPRSRPRQRNQRRRRY